MNQTKHRNRLNLEPVLKNQSRALNTKKRKEEVSSIMPRLANNAASVET
jgi:hypothetical protein